MWTNHGVEKVGEDHNLLPNSLSSDSYRPLLIGEPPQSKYKLHETLVALIYSRKYRRTLKPLAILETDDFFVTA